MIAILDYLNRSHTEEMLNRFLSYVKIDTQSNRHAEKTPTTEGQWDLAHKLEQELLELGISELELNSNGYLIAHIPASPGKEHAPCIGLMAHMDTASDVSG
ncbi:MAG: peptidase T, partial [Rectinema sp.]